MDNECSLREGGQAGKLLILLLNDKTRKNLV